MISETDIVVHLKKDERLTFAMILDARERMLINHIKPDSEGFYRFQYCSQDFLDLMHDAMFAKYAKSDDIYSGGLFKLCGIKFIPSYLASIVSDGSVKLDSSAFQEYERLLKNMDELSVRIGVLTEGLVPKIDLAPIYETQEKRINETFASFANVDLLAPGPITTAPASYSKRCEFLKLPEGAEQVIGMTRGLKADSDYSVQQINKGLTHQENINRIHDQAIKNLRKDDSVLTGLLDKAAKALISHQQKIENLQEAFELRGKVINVLEKRITELEELDKLNCKTHVDLRAADRRQTDDLIAALGFDLKKEFDNFKEQLSNLHDSTNTRLSNMRKQSVDLIALKFQDTERQLVDRIIVLEVGMESLANGGKSHLENLGNAHYHEPTTVEEGDSPDYGCGDPVDYR